MNKNHKEPGLLKLTLQWAWHSMNETTEDGQVAISPRKELSQSDETEWDGVGSFT